jgi:predicted enzyme related to lactoylglutathione lyase
MAERTSYAPGTFSWIDLATTDPVPAKAFYAALFGWSYDDRPVSQGVHYSMALLDGAEVAAINPLPETMRAAGAPPAWMSYVTVADADAAAALATELGGQVYNGPFDVLTAGRMAVLADAEGAVLSVWQAGDNVGARRVNEPGTLTWNKLATRDVPAARRFYSELFGWTFEGPDDQYVVIRNGERSNGGLRPMSPAEEGMPPAWTPYFAAKDVEALASAASEHGGGVLAGPTDVPAGRFVALHDPQRAAFAVFEGSFDD